MGWAGGSQLLDEVAETVMPHIAKEKRADVADLLVNLFTGEDCDALDECEQSDIKRAVRRYYKAFDALEQ